MCLVEMHLKQKSKNHITPHDNQDFYDNEDFYEQGCVHRLLRATLKGNNMNHTAYAARPVQLLSLLYKCI